MDEIENIAPKKAKRGDDSEKAIIVKAAPLWLSKVQILRHALKGACRASLLSYSIKGGMALLLAVINVIRKGNRGFNLLRILTDPATLRFTGMITSFTFIWKAVVNLLERQFGRSKRNGFIAGSLAGLSILIETPKQRVAFAQNFFFRAMQSFKNALKLRGMPTLPNGDSYIFCFSTASILYAYAMRPETIPRDYYKWMVKIAQVPKSILELHRGHSKSGSNAIDKEKWLSTLTNLRATPHNLTKFDTYLKANGGEVPGFPCELFHPRSDDCTSHNVSLWMQVFKDMSPIYASLSLVPLIFLNPLSLIRNPVKRLTQIAKSVFISSSFLAFLITTFQTGMCLYTTLLPNLPVKPFIYPLAFVSSLWIFLEQKSKRVELALFVLPKGVGSVYMVLREKGMSKIRGLETTVFCLSMGIIMSLFQLEPENISSLMYRVMRAILGDF